MNAVQGLRSMDGHAGLCAFKIKKFGKMKQRNMVKKEVTRFRREVKRHRNPPLIHILINVRSTTDWQCDHATLFGLILSLKNQHREYGLKRAIVQKYGGMCFRQSDIRKWYGKRTVYEDGQFKSAYTQREELPF